MEAFSTVLLGKAALPWALSSWVVTKDRFLRQSPSAQSSTLTLHHNTGPLPPYCPFQDADCSCFCLCVGGSRGYEKGFSFKSSFLIKQLRIILKSSITAKCSHAYTCIKILTKKSYMICYFSFAYYAHFCLNNPAWMQCDAPSCVYATSKLKFISNHCSPGWLGTNLYLKFVTHEGKVCLETQMINWKRKMLVKKRQVIFYEVYDFEN